MTKPLKLIAIGNSTGVVFPRDVLAVLGVERGDNLDVVQTASGIQIKRHDPEFEEQITAARAVMRRRRDALRELAK